MKWKSLFLKCRIKKVTKYQPKIVLNETIVSEDDSFEGNKYHFIYDSGDITINCQCGLSYTIEKE